ncbi:cobalamin B12-binding domain-containing protein [Carboxydothermus pertinax]|uniref:Cobalamin-binding protein n=1 Tax=Carboxydothermus pertinax TaxID=870242 RepID=A0A1L8CVN7_9THEO|nr:cobalamin-dependent protein [Carboxydothermus pertinax]GAV22909.1 cobalamin-binding protein [Carboxydothermus pertinax]
MLDKIFNLIVELEEDEAIGLAKKYIEEGGNPQKLLEACGNAMGEIGQRFEKGEYFLSELILAGDIFKSIMEFTLPKLKQGEVTKVGKMVLGTVHEDVHNIGKDIFKVFAEASGFEVIDIGIDTPPEKFVEAVKEHKPDIVGMSCLITAGVSSMKKTVDALREAGLRDKVKIIIGGGRVDEGVKEFAGADAWADDAAKGVRLCKELLGLEG